ncbi:MAG TPA: aminotransferase class IV [Cyclobacteriaceae bacterium]|nr:aminotransferase class IV [Cyclobacteriaceae bacterium]
MSRLIESIKLFNGELYNLAYHQQRVDKTLQELAFSTTINLASGIQVPQDLQNGFFKCRVIYDNHGIAHISFEPYQIRPIHKLKMIVADDLNYEFKWEDRSALNNLLNKRGEADDILIVKNGLITDASYANLAFRKADRWYPPIKPLLKGTMRKKLVDEHIITPIDISYTDLHLFETCKLINALLEFNGPEIAVTDIVF